MDTRDLHSEIETLYALARLYDEQHATFTEDFAMYDALARDYGGPVLELGIGNGRVGLELARRGHEVWGIDLSAEMLALAGDKAKAAGLTVRLERGDMADFDLRTELAAAGHAGFGLIIVPFNSLCHLTDTARLESCLAAVRRHLAPGGVFAPSLFVPLPQFLYRDPDSLNFVDRFLSASRGEEVELYESNRYDPIRQLNHLRWYFVGMDSEETVERTFTLRMYYPREIRDILARNGLRVVEEWGDYSERLTTPAALRQGLGPDTVTQTIVCRSQDA